MAEIQTIQIKREVKPLFADNIGIELEIKSDKINLKDKEFHTRLVFIDSKTLQTVSEVVISRLTARDLRNMLDDIIKKCDEIIKTGKLPQQLIKSTIDAPSYMG